MVLSQAKIGTRKPHRRQRTGYSSMDVQAKSFLAIPRNDRWHGGRLDNDLVRETIERTGAFIMGKRMFDEGEANWPEDLYKTPEYVLTNEKNQPVESYFENDRYRYYFSYDAQNRI